MRKQEIVEDSSTTRPLRRRGAARRGAIIKAAAELFLAQSYERTTLDQIVERAGGSKALVYEQFGDKEGLFKAVMLELCENIFHPVDAPNASRGRTPKTPKAVLTALGEQFLRTICSEDVLALTRVIFNEGARHPEIADVFFVSGYDEGFQRLAAYLETIAPGRLTQARRVQLSMIFFCMMKGDAFDRRLAGTHHQRRPAEVKEQVRLAVAWLLQQMGLES